MKEIAPMIDPLAEALISPTDAAKIFPKARSGKPVHVSFVYRAMKCGCKGVVLESIRTPKLATSRQAVARFITALTEQGRSCEHAPERRHRSAPNAAAVERELDHLGL
jgi:hypothetical protein